MKRLPLLSLVPLLAAPTFAESIHDLRPDLSDEIDPLVAPFAFAGLTLLNDVELERSGIEIDIEEYRFSTPLTPSGIDIGERTKLYLELDASYTRIENVILAGTAEYQRYRLPVSVFHDVANSPWQVFATVTPEYGLETSIDNTSDAFFFNGLLGARYVFSDDLSVFAGATYTRALGDEELLPTVGIDWRINEKTAFQLRGMTASISHRLNDSIILRLVSAPVGGYWASDIANFGNEGDFGLLAQNLGLGIDYKLTESVWLSVQGGVTIGGEVAVENRGGGARREQDIDGGTYGYIGLKVFSW